MKFRFGLEKGKTRSPRCPIIKYQRIPAILQSQKLKINNGGFVSEFRLDEEIEEIARIQANYRKFEEDNADLIQPPVGETVNEVPVELATNYTIGDLS